MFAKSLTTTSLIAAIALSPIVAAPAQAQDAREVIGGLLLGGAVIAGIAAANQPRTRVLPVIPHPNDARPAQPQAQPHRPSAPRVVRPAIPATEAGRQVQTALNYFGFNAGYVDGQVGPATRNAVERYQTFQGYPVNGRAFPEPQALHLINAYQWATTGGQGATGLQGQPLLLAYAGALNGAAPAAATAGNTTIIVNPASSGLIPAPNAPVLAIAEGGPNVLVPNLFAGAASAAPVLSARCDAVALQGQANGGMMTLGNLSNPGFALSEQFCTARASAVNQGHDLTQAITGLSYAEITVQCEGFSDAVAGQTALIGSLTPEQAVGSAQSFVYSSGIPQAELAATARVCLGVAYGADDMDMAMGSALILVSAGEPAYGELLGHHLREGFGTQANDYNAHAWYSTSLTAVEGGAPAVFNASDAGRLPLIRQAVASALQGQPVPVPAAVFVPTLNIAPAPVLAPVLAPSPVRAPGIAPVAAPANPEIIFAPQALPTFQVNQ